MAKQTVGPVERHLEKGILGIAALVLIAAVVKFVVTSPNHVEVSGRDVTPGTIDKVVWEQADQVRNAIRAAKPPEYEVEPLLPRLAAALDPIKFAGISPELRTAVAFLPKVPLIDVVKAKGTIKLVDPLPLGKPVMTTGRSTLCFAPVDEWTTESQDADEYFPFAEPDNSVPVNWVTVSAVWQREAQRKAMIQAYGKARAEPLLGGIEVQRRARRPDGSWSDEDWQTIAPYVRAQLPEIPPIELKREGDRVLPTSEGLQVANGIFNLLQTPVVQMNLMRPRVIPPLNGDVWKFPAIEGMDPVGQDDEFFFPWVAGDYRPVRSRMVDRYPKEDKETKTVGWQDPNAAVKLTDEQLKNWRDTLAKTEAEYRSAFKVRDEVGENTAYNVAAMVFLTGPTAESKRKANELLSKFKQMVEDRKIADQEAKQREILVGRRNRQSQTTSRSDEVIPHPKSPVEQVWAIDGGLGSVVGGQTYQYRLRPLLFNPFVSQPGQLSNAEDAKVVFVRGAWSPLSDPVYVKPEKQYFARFASRGKVSFDIYRWFDGKWIKGQFKIGVGDVVGGLQRVALDEGKPNINFAAHELVLNIDNQRPWRERRRAGRGVRYGRPDASTAVVLVDARGRISERILDIDRSDPAARDLSKKLYKPKPKVEEESPQATGAPVRRGGGRGEAEGGVMGGGGYGEPSSGGKGGGGGDRPRPRPKPKP